MNFDALNNQPRLLIKANLQPVQGARFQPTGFPDLGAAEFDGPDGQRMLLVESEQSIANHLERTVYKEFSRDTVSDGLADAVIGLPYVNIDLGEFGRTNTLLEAHRLNTPYLWDSEHPSALAFQEILLRDLGMPAKRKKKGENSDESGEGNEVAGVLDMKRFYRMLLKYDINSLLHGVFLEKVAGRLRLTRTLSGFVEAYGVVAAVSGGVKNDRVFPKKDESFGINSKEGYVNVPFSRTEYVAKERTAFFNIDLAMIRSFGLGGSSERLLIVLALYKIRRFLDEGLRLRASCIFEMASDWVVTRPENYTLPSRVEIETSLPGLIKSVTDEGNFANPPVTNITWTKGKKKIAIELPRDTAMPTAIGNLAQAVKWKKGSARKGPSLEVTGIFNDELVGALCGMFEGDLPAQGAIRNKLGAPVNSSEDGLAGE